MKQKTNHIILLFLATAIFFVGAGVTIVDLCCSACPDNLISLAEPEPKDVCIQHLKEVQKIDDCCSEKSHEMSVDCNTPEHHKGEQCCKKERVSIDLDNTIYKHKLSTSLVWTVVSLFYNNSLLLSTDERYICPDVVDEISIPPRDYLSLIRILII